MFDPFICKGGKVTMLKLKGCPRCKGDVRIDRDEYGWYEECIQCGHVCDLKSVVIDQKQDPEKPKVIQEGKSASFVVKKSRK